MNKFDIPIYKKSYLLYKIAYEYRHTVPKQDRYALWQRCENTIIDILEGILQAGQVSKSSKLPILETISLKINCLRVFIRLAKDVKAIDNKKYIRMESMIDEIGRMIGGWIKASKER